MLSNPYLKLTLDPNWQPFTYVVKGMDVVDKIYKIGERPNQGQIQV